MTIELTELIIELASPAQRATFERDPASYPGFASLDQSEQDVLLSGNPFLIRNRARSTVSTDPTQQFNRHFNPDLVIEVSFDLHLVLESHDMVAVGGAGLLFTDADGKLYRAIQATG